MIRENNEEQPPEPPRANVGTRQHPLPEDTSPTTELTAKIIIEKYGENRLGTRPFHDETSRLLNMSSQLAHISAHSRPHFIRQRMRLAGTSHMKQKPLTIMPKGE
ncbi:hypothetical protein COMA1_10139 [Candidatus Nitrospira nitrosa]|uniref:Uncharacterized protein n=1 Tax=Candidatus Nitrospira nitrosa TaxID=1742972 RepID=A0A0S4L1H3_9BACT|nr:hypothetical protein COMA1_10139 [Candidatus Nitrospira nitrosa]